MADVFRGPGKQFALRGLHISARKQLDARNGHSAHIHIHTYEVEELVVLGRIDALSEEYL